MFGKVETIEPSAFSKICVIRSLYLMVKHKIQANILLIARIFLASSEARKNISQLAKYPRALCVKPSNIVCVSMMHRVHTCLIYIYIYIYIYTHKKVSVPN